MESGFKRLFTSMRWKTKSAPNAEPGPEIPRRTSSHDGLPVGSSPTKGAWPRRPSQEKFKQKSLSHLRTKSNATQELKPSTEPALTMRPRTAPGNNKSNSSRSPSLRSKFHHRSRASQDDKHTRSNVAEGVPNIPELPKGLADMGGARYYDQKQVALFNKYKRHSESTCGSVDVYNEKAVIWNSNQPADISPKEDLKSLPNHVHKNPSPSKKALDAQRVSFEMMRASRNARTSAERIIIERERLEEPVLSVNGKKDHPGQATPQRSPERQSQEPSLSNSAPHKATLSKTRARRSPRGHTGSQQLSSVALHAPPAWQIGFSPRSPSEEDAACLVAEEKVFSTATAITVPAPRNSSIYSQQTQQSESEAFSRPTSETLEDKSKNPEFLAADQTNDSPPSCAQKSRADSALKDDVTTSNGTGRVNEQSKRDSRDTLLTLESNASGKIPNIKDPSQVISYGVAIATRPTASEKNSNEDDHSDSDIEMVDAVAHQPEDGQNVPLEEGTSATKQEVNALDQQDATSGARQGKQNNSTASIDPSLQTSTTPSDPGSRPGTEKVVREGIFSESGLSSPNPVPTSGFLQLPPRSQAAPKTSISQVNSSNRLGPTDRRKSETSQSKDQRRLEPRAAAAPSSLSTTTSPCTPAPKIVNQAQPSHAQGPDLVSTPVVITRDFAPCCSIPAASGAHSRTQVKSKVSSGPRSPATTRSRLGISGRDTHIQPPQTEDESAELERSIAQKKQAAAEALLRLQEVMAKPAWEAAMAADQARMPTKAPSHWRGLSVDDGSPVAPSAIFNKVKMPPSSLPVSQHSTFTRKDGRALGRSAGPSAAGNGKSDVLGRPSRTEHKPAALRDAVSKTSGSRPASIDSAEAPLSRPRAGAYGDGKGRNSGSTVVSKSKQPHSRKGSAVSASSGTSSVHSLPYHMVPVRGSSTRDSDSIANDSGGDRPRFPVRDSGWR